MAAAVVGDNGARKCAYNLAFITLAGVVLRVDSPGGDALASDLMWREIQQLAEKKPVVACMGDVAASGGYYMSMAAQVRGTHVAASVRLCVNKTMRLLRPGVVCATVCTHHPFLSSCTKVLCWPHAISVTFLSWCCGTLLLQAIVAQPLTVTGSIGVVTGKFNLAELYERVGYAKTLLSRGKFAEFLAADNRCAAGRVLAAAVVMPQQQAFELVCREVV
jgi:hypothetical protein